METQSFPRNVDELRTALAAGRMFRYRPFYGHTPRKDGALSDVVFSQFYNAEFVVEGVTYRFAEQWMMAGKARVFGDQEILGKILGAKTPAECKALGRKVRGFQEAIWRQERFAIVVAGNVHKFGQDPVLREYLLGTSEDVLVEASPSDRIWGIGLSMTDPAAKDPLRWRGQNLLGFALMEARAHLRAQMQEE